MAKLTPIEEKLAEVLGLALAAQDTTQKVQKLAEDEESEVRELLQRMHDEAAQTEERARAVAAEREGKKTAIEDKARETRQEAEEMRKTYLGDDSDALDGFEFLVMTEAGELGHAEIVQEMNKTVGDDAIEEFIRFALPIQERHVQSVRQTALQLAAEEAKES